MLRLRRILGTVQYSMQCSHCISLANVVSKCEWAQNPPVLLPTRCLLGGNGVTESSTGHSGEPRQVLSPPPEGRIGEDPIIVVEKNSNIFQNLSGLRSSEKKGGMGGRVGGG